MKKILFCAMIMIMALYLSTRADAALIIRGVDDVDGNRLIYDDDRDITWYDFSNAFDTWHNQVAWASALTVTFNSTPYDDWRLPSALNDVAPFGPDTGFNVTGSEMGHLYYTELGNLGLFDTSGNAQAGFGLNNTGDFQNLLSSVYWSGTEASSIYVWLFDFIRWRTERARRDLPKEF